MATAVNMAQDVVWCDVCPSDQFLKSSAELRCRLCSINLCQGCAGKHLLSKTPSGHDVVEYKLKEAEPKHPECQTHPGKKCELHCQQCQVPVCVACLAGSHQQHRLAEISVLVESKIAQILQDNEELENVLAPEYEKQDSQTDVQLSEKAEKYNALITSIAEHGKDWHKEVDKIVNKHTTDVQKDKRDDLGHLQKYQSEIRNTKSLIYQTIEKNKNILKSNDITELANYRSRNAEFKQISPRLKFTLPSFQPMKIQGEKLLRQFGTLSASIKSEIQGFTITMADHMSDALSIKEPLYKSHVIATTESGKDDLLRINCVGSDEVWISGRDTTIRRVNIHSMLLQEVTDVCRNMENLICYPQGQSVNKNGDLLYCDDVDGFVKMIKDKKIHTVIAIQNWRPLAVCSSSSGDVLVLMIKGNIILLLTKGGKNVKLVRYSGTVVKHEIQNDENGRPLFSNSYHNRYIEKNKNQDICVKNDGHIVVLNRSGQLRFRYNGHLINKSKKFNPRGIVTDSKCQILVADKNSNCVHVIDKDGHFLCYIGNCGLVDPAPLSVDSNGRLWVGLRAGKIKVIKYMK